MEPWIAGSVVQARPGMDGLSDANAAIAAQVASDLLFELSGRQFSTETRTVRPSGCGRGCQDGWTSNIVGWGLPLQLASYLGPWPIAGPAGGYAAPCDWCDRWSTGAIDLVGPLVWDDTHLITVTVDGAVLDTSKWSVVSPNRIIRTDGGVFPQCQDMRVATTAVGTCSITYSAGMVPPMAGKQAAASLAAEYAKFLKFLPTDQECNLPQRIKQITRQGVTAIAIDPMDIIKSGGTGLTDVDLFINAVNPHHLHGPANVLIPGFDDRSPSVHAGTAGGFS